MNDNYSSLLDLLDEVSNNGFEYVKLSDTRIKVYEPFGIVYYSCRINNSWSKDKAGF